MSILNRLCDYEIHCIGQFLEDPRFLFRCVGSKQLELEWYYNVEKILDNYPMNMISQMNKLSQKFRENKWSFGGCQKGSHGYF